MFVKNKENKFCFETIKPESSAKPIKVGDLLNSLLIQKDGKGNREGEEGCLYDFEETKTVELVKSCLNKSVLKKPNASTQERDHPINLSKILISKYFDDIGHEHREK